MPNVVRSNYFTVDLNGSRDEVYIVDKPNDDVVAPVYSGTGTLQLKTKSLGVVIAKDIGTIDYDTGQLIFFLSISYQSVEHQIHN